MKKYIFTLLILSLSLFGIAQDKRSFIGLQSGPSFPVGKYQSKTLPDGSFTQTGISASIEGVWFFKSWLGVGGSAGAHFHPVDVRALGYEKVQADPFMNDVFIRSDPYSSYSFYIGMYFEQALIQRLSATAKASGGVIFARTPYQLYKADYYLVGEKWFEITSSGDYEASFLAGAGLKYELKNCIGFTLNSEFTWNQADFDFISAGGQIRTDQKIIAFINLTAGLIIKIIPAAKP